MPVSPHGAPPDVNARPVITSDDSNPLSAPSAGQQRDAQPTPFFGGGGIEPRAVPFSRLARLWLFWRACVFSGFAGVRGLPWLRDRYCGLDQGGWVDRAPTSGING